MFKILFLLNLFSFFKNDTVFTDYIRMCDISEKEELSNCDEMMLNSSFIFSDSNEYIYQSISHFQDGEKLEKNVYSDFHIKYYVDTCFVDSLSKKYIFNTSYGNYLLIRYFSVPMIKVYFFDYKEEKINQTIYFNTNFLNNNK
jgi:hypothetical protein